MPPLTTPTLITRKSLRLSSILFFTLGAIWLFILLPLVSVTTGELKPKGTYFSENALLPGGGSFQLSEDDLNWARRELNRHGSKGDGGNGDVVMDSHRERRRRVGEMLGMDPLFSFAREEEEEESSLPTKEREKVEGGIISSSLSASDRRESIVLVSRRGSGDEGSASHSDVALYAFGKMLSRAEWLSKDVVLISTSSFSALQSWLRRYYSNSTDASLNRAGPMRAAVVIDIGSTSLEEEEEFSVNIQGNNGVLPNLDFVNVSLYGRNFNRFTLVPPTRVRLDWIPEDLRRMYEDKYLFGHVFSYMAAFGPTGWHAPFLNLNVDAVTVKVRVRGSEKEMTRGMTVLANCVEEMVRCVSNLEEKLHHSYYFYVMLDTKSFVPVDEYLLPFFLLLSPLLLHALYVATFFSLNPRRMSDGESNEGKRGGEEFRYFDWSLEAAGNLAFATALSSAFFALRIHPGIAFLVYFSVLGCCLFLASSAGVSRGELNNRGDEVDEGFVDYVLIEISKRVKTDAANPSSSSLLNNSASMRDLVKSRITGGRRTTAASDADETIIRSLTSDLTTKLREAYDNEAPKRWEFHLAFVELLLVLSHMALGTLYFPLGVMSAVFFALPMTQTLNPSRRTSRLAFLVVFGATNVAAFVSLLLPRLLLTASPTGEFWGSKNNDLNDGDNGLERLFFAYDSLNTVHVLLIYFVILPSQMVMGGLLISCSLSSTGI